MLDPETIKNCMREVAGRGISPLPSTGAGLAPVPGFGAGMRQFHINSRKSHVGEKKEDIGKRLMEELKQQIIPF